MNDKGFNNYLESVINAYYGVSDRKLSLIYGHTDIKPLPFTGAIDSLTQASNDNDIMFTPNKTIKSHSMV